MTIPRFEFDRVVFFGRRLEEYVKMFDLNVQELVGKSILDVAGGPASFAKDAAELGIHVVACDPMYDATPEELRGVVDLDSETVLKKQQATPNIFHAELEPTSRRREDMEAFLNDFATGKPLGRYVAASLPNLPFTDNTFDFTLQANLLFLYSDIASGGMMERSPFDYEFHSKAIKELLRIARTEVRIYPLQGPSETEHAYLRRIMHECESTGHKATVEPVAQRDLIGAEFMLRIIKHC